MKRNWKRICCVFLAICFLAVSLIGCGDSSDTKSPAATDENTSSQDSNTSQQTDAKEDDDPYADLPMELSITILDRGRVPAEEGSYEDNRWTRWINENSGVKVTWIPIPRTQSFQKINALIATGEAPDIMWEFGTAFMRNLQAQGVIQPIDEYVEKYSTVYKEYLKANPELLPYITVDGQMYGATSKRGIDKIANHGMWIRQDWLDNLGLDMPTTIEELLEVARAFKNQDPDGNGKDDTYGIAFNPNWIAIINALFFCSGVYIEDGKVEISELTDRYMDVMNFRKTLFQEGLIDQEYITDTNFQRERQIWVTGKAGIYLGSYTPPEFREFRENNPDAVIVPLEPVATKYGKNGLFQEPPAHKMLTFNKDMKNPKAAMKYLDWVLEEGWFTILFGFEGEHYRLVDGVPQAIDAEKNIQELNYAYEYAILDQWDPKPEWFTIMAAQDPISQEEAKLKAMGLETALKNPFRRDVPYTPNFSELTELAQFGSIRDEIVTQVVTGELSPEEGLERIRAEYERLGGSKNIELLQKWYDENKDDLVIH